MEKETATIIRQIVQEAIARRRLEETLYAPAEDAYARYCENEDFEEYVKTVLDLLLERASPE